MDESNYDEFSLSSLIFNDEKEFIIEYGRKKKVMGKFLWDNEGKILLDDNKYILKLV